MSPEEREKAVGGPALKPPFTLVFGTPKV